MALFQPFNAEQLVEKEFFAPESKFNILGGIQQVIEQGRAGAADRQLQGAVTATVQGSATPDQIGLMFKNDPAKALKVLEGVGVRNQQQASNVARAAFNIRNTPFAQRGPLIQQAAQQIQQIGGDPTRILSMLNMDEQQQNEFASVFEQASLSVTQRQEQGLAERKVDISEQNLELDRALTGAQIGNIRSQIANRNRPTATPLIREEKIAQAVGLKKGTKEYKDLVLQLAQKAPGAIVNVGGNPLTPDQQIKMAVEIKKQEEKAKRQGQNIAAFQKIDIEEGKSAANILPTLLNTQGLLKTIKTGGIDAAILRGKQLLGIESADEAELTNNMGKAVLSQLKVIFGSAFTEKEGRLLLDMEAGLGKSTAGNVRLIERGIDAARRRIQIGFDAAIDSGDKRTARILESFIDSGLDLGGDENVIQFDRTGKRI